MNKLKRNALTLLVGLVLTTGNSSGAPAHPGLVTYQQPDGSELTVRICGDENLHWYESADGTLLQADKEGMLTVADRDYSVKLSERRAAPRRASAYTTFPTQGAQKALVILVQFTDRSFSYGLDYFKQMLSEPGYSTYGSGGSARDYFIENSCGAFIPEFDVFGPVSLSHEISYYGSDDDALAYEMVSEACRQLDDQIDFSQYDRDGDGWVDNIYLFYAGYGEADGGGTNTIWPHSANIYNKGTRLLLDGVQIGQYACSNELIGSTSSMVGIGTFCHEFAHVLGLPDLYATNGNDIDTPYYWSLMEHGNYNSNGRRPCNLTAYERFFLGWADPVEISLDGSLRIPPIEKNLFYRVSVPGSSEEYFLLENRQQQGWDSALPGHGLLIWHIDYDRTVWDNNAVNNDASRQRVDLLEADGKPAMSSSSGDPFPGTANVTSFSGLTPRNQQAMEMTFSNIRESNGDIILNVNSASTLPTAPTALNSENVEDNYATLKWQESNDADEYRLSLVSYENGRVRPLPEYTMRTVNATEINISGLEPETDYEASLYAVKGIALSEPSAVYTFTTDQPGITYFAPTALEATNISENGFTANWEPLSMADSYLLSLYTMVAGSADADVVPFSSPLEIPEGWETNVSTTMSVSGYYGDAAPALRMSNNADMIVSPTYDNDITSFSFWLRGYKADASTSLRVEAAVEGNWQEVDVITEIDNTSGRTYTYSDLPAGTRAMRLVLTNSGNGSACVDDITVGFGNIQVPEYIFYDKDCGNNTQYAVDGLSRGKIYYYHVAALNGEKRSQTSNEISVIVGSSKLETTSTDEDIIDIYRPDGIRVGKALPSTPGIYIIRTSTRTIKIHVI